MGDGPTHISVCFMFQGLLYIVDLEGTIWCWQSDGLNWAWTKALRLR
jgi:hypothetical protein